MTTGAQASDQPKNEQFMNPSSTDKIAKSHVTTGVQVSDQPKNQQFILVTIFINACTQINVYFHFRKVELTS